MRCATARARPGTMRSMTRLLPALQAAARVPPGSAAQVALRRTAASATAGESAAATASPLLLLRQSLVYELNRGCCNSQGRTVLFDQFLVGQLELLGHQLPPAYLQDAQNYRHMSRERRDVFCNELLKAADQRLGGVTGGAGTSDSSSSSSSSSVAAAGVEAGPGTATCVALAQVQPPSSGPAGIQSVGAPQAQATTPAAPAPAAGPSPVVPVAAAAGRETAAAAAAAGSAAFMDEWALTLEEQCQRPFLAPEPSTLLRPVPIVFDLETNARSHLTNHIVQLAALHVDSGASFNRRVRLPADKEMNPGASQVNGIYTDDAQSTQWPEFEQVYTELFDWLWQQAAAAGPGAYLLLIGHNIRGFDLRVLLRHAGLARLPTLRDARFLDTYSLAKAAIPSVNSPGQPLNLQLGTLFEHFTQEEPVGAHDALADCKMNVHVLRGLLSRLPELPANDLSTQLHAAATMPDVNWCGWVDTLKQQEEAEKQQRANGKRRPAKPGAHSSSIADELAGQAADVGEWWTPDPLALVESAGAVALVRAEESGSGDSESAAARALSMEERRAQVAAVQAGWQALVQEPSLRSSLLSTPISQLKKKGVGFTDKQQSNLESGKVLTLGQLLECYPSRLLTSQPGRLPEEGDTDAVVTLAARLKSPAFIKKTNGGAFFLKADLQVVHPSEAGISTPWLPQDAYGDRQCTLQIFDFRVGRYALHALNQLKAKLEQAGPVMVLSGPAKLQPIGEHNNHTDMWRLDPAKLRVLLPEEGRAAFSQGQSSTQLVVVHPSRGDVTPSNMRLMVDKGLKLAEAAVNKGALQDPLPEWVLSQYGLMPLMPALRAMHQPGSEEELEAARARLAFQEFVALQLKLLVQRNLAWGGVVDSGGGSVLIDGRSSQLLELGLECLGYQLTRGQQAALDEILRQMEGWPPMQCLLQGDVGCGKTVVAFLALLAAAGAGYQGAIMAPTEILAEQHYRNLQQLVHGMNREVTRRRLSGFQLPRVALLTGSVKGKARTLLNDSLARGDIEIAVGTHALVSESTQFHRLGLAVVDEQHKFGVEQRGRLLAKASPAPHVLHMTATPIPRTQALIDHGDMSQVVIQDLPLGRTPVTTLALEDGSPSRLQMYDHIREEMAKGHCIYIVCPFVEESDKLAEVKAATAEAERLVSEGVFAAADCGLLHGQMAPVDKEAVLQDFKAGRVKVLVSTTVVEVGVDVPQATVMVIEHAERFGFAQLHQLRGRVGRSERKSFCYLVYSNGIGFSAQKKMKVLVNCNNGFAVAECDLEMRGAGEVLGKRQSGRDAKASFKAAQIPGDRILLEQAREAASILLAQHPDPRQWPVELRAMVADEGLLQLDTLSIPTLGYE